MMDATRAATFETIGNLVRAGRMTEAQAAIDAALAAEPIDPTLLDLGGMLAARAGDASRAAGYFERLLASRPDDRATRLNLAQALIALDMTGRVAALCAPLAGDPAADRLAAYAALSLADHATARRLYRAVVGTWPDDPDSWANLGNAYVALGEIDEAIDAFERAITLRPREARFYLNLAGVLERADRNEARLRVMRDAAAAQPGDAEVQLALGLAEAAADDLDAAEAALRRAIALAPGSPAAYVELGLLLENRNRIDALAALADAARPHLGAELALLDGWVAFRRGRFEEAAALAAQVPETVSPIRRAHLKAMAADRCGDATTAFALFAAMNAEVRAAASLKGATPSYRETVVAATAALRDSPDRRPREAGDDGVPTPVFVAGFPRSGTTLLDTMLGGLPTTHVLEEQPLIPAIEQRLGRIVAITPLDPASIAAARVEYREGLGRLVPGWRGARIIDKHPLHMARMPLIDQLFPGAKILFVERHPYDVVLSCFMANFRPNHAMLSFTDLDEAARTYDAVLTCWTEARARLDLDIHAVRYERLVETPEAELGEAVAFLGATFDPALLDTAAAAQARGHVKTASYAQIGEPIYRRSVDRWRHYRAQLAPVAMILDPWVERLGYAL